MDELTHGQYLVQRPIGLAGCVPGDKVAEADRGQGDEQVVDGVEVVPPGLEEVESHRGEQEYEDEDKGPQEAGVE